MDKNTFLLEDKIKKIELNFIDKGWIVAYENDSTSLKDYVEGTFYLTCN